MIACRAMASVIAGVSDAVLEPDLVRDPVVLCEEDPDNVRDPDGVRLIESSTVAVCDRVALIDSISLTELLASWESELVTVWDGVNVCEEEPVDDIVAVLEIVLVLDAVGDIERVGDNDKNVTVPVLVHDGDSEDVRDPDAEGDIVGLAVALSEAVLLPRESDPDAEGDSVGLAVVLDETVVLPREVDNVGVVVTVTGGDSDGVGLADAVIDLDAVEDADTDALTDEDGLRPPTHAVASMQEHSHVSIFVATSLKHRLSSLQELEHATLVATAATGRESYWLGLMSSSPPTLLQPINTAAPDCTDQPRWSVRKSLPARLPTRETSEPGVTRIAPAAIRPPSAADLDNNIVPVLLVRVGSPTVKFPFGTTAIRFVVVPVAKRTTINPLEMTDTASDRMMEPDALGGRCVWFWMSRTERFPSTRIKLCAASRVC
jgi:hypothetical protein